jgi:hypothetical protein
MRSFVRWRGLTLSVVIAVVVVSALIALILREGPDHTLTGRVRSIELHGICVGRPTDGPACIHVDAPEDVADVHPGDCVRVRYSADDLLIALQSASTCG